MAKHRFYIPKESWNPDELVLSGDDAHHCRDVMRCREGQSVIVFDGAGTEIEGRITLLSRKRIELKAVREKTTERPPAFLTLGQAIPKGKNMDLIIQKVTELGVGRIVPLLSARTVVQLNEKEAAKKREKWQRIAIEACKQCGQNWLPEVAAPLAVDAFVKAAAEKDHFRLVAAIDPESRSLKSILNDWEKRNKTRPVSATLMIGPEGDFTGAEVSAARESGFHPMTLGPIILRSETAAIYAVSVVGHELMTT